MKVKVKNQERTEGESPLCTRWRSREAKADPYSFRENLFHFGKGSSILGRLHSFRASRVHSYPVSGDQFSHLGNLYSISGRESSEYRRYVRSTP